MSGVVVLLESNTTGTGRLFARAAAHLGYEPVLLCADPDRYPYAAEDGLRVEVLDTTDEAAVLAAARALDPVGVTSSSEYFIAPAAAVAAALGLPAADAEAIRNCRDKGIQRRTLAAAGVPVPAFRAAETVDDAVAAAVDLGVPVVLKPVSGSGSIGVRLCNDVGEVAAHAATLLAQAVNERGIPVPGRLLVEELAVGPEYSAEAFDGQVVGIVRKHLSPPPAFLEVGHDFPAPLPDDDAAAVHAVTEAALEALGLCFGPTHVELRLTTDGPVLIEVNPRLAGGNIPELVRHASGVDLVTETVRLVTGGRPHLDPTRHRHSAIRFLLAPAAGTLEGVDGADRAEAVDGVVDVRVTRGLGDSVTRAGDFRDRIGHVLTCGATAENAQAAAEAALACFDVRVKAEAD
ncbi:MAG: ATP-grasp domain-containing protein [Actinobacteria bacterium]|nr:ATP-grasp domain-containing protein [Actinomycetota bacterium]